MKEIIDVIAIHFEKGYILVLLHFTLIHFVTIKIHFDKQVLFSKLNQDVHSKITYTNIACLRAMFFHPMALANRGIVCTILYDTESARTISIRATGLPLTTFIIMVFFTILQTRKKYMIKETVLSALRLKTTGLG